MFKSYVLKQIDFDNHCKLIIKDNEEINKKTHFIDVLLAHGFDVYEYSDDLTFRIDMEDCFKKQDKKIAIIVNSDVYIPYDVLSKAKYVHLSIRNLFPKLDETAIKKSNVDYDLLTVAYNYNFISNGNYAGTKSFIENNVYSKDTVNTYITLLSSYIHDVPIYKNYVDWFGLAKTKAKIKSYALKYKLIIPKDSIDKSFKEFILSDFGKLSSIIAKDSPILVSKVMDYITERSKKFAFIVMDGMSMFDWQIISDSFYDLNYVETNVFAMIPTVTSISRQCLLSNKYPVQLIKPWSQSKEKQEFIDYAKSAGYLEHQISYQRGYDINFNPNIECLAIIINDIDDMVHGQRQGIEGMFNDVSLMSKQSKLAQLTKILLKEGFDVYISADHGNTNCAGIGSFRTGVETETKSRRMLVLKDIADKKSWLEKYPLIEYPKYYLDKQYDYLICDNGVSFDNKGEEVITHGGISIEEVIVPFIILKSEDNNG